MRRTYRSVDGGGAQNKHRKLHDFHLMILGIRVIHRAKDLIKLREKKIRVTTETKRKPENNNTVYCNNIV